VAFEEAIRLDPTNAAYWSGKTVTCPTDGGRGNR
jgi:hypothetical protein